MADSCDKKVPSEKEPLEINPSDKDPANRLMLMLMLRKQHARAEFARAVNDLEHLDLAKNFPEKVSNIAGISQRFKAFIESLPENEEALKDVINLLEKVANAK